MSPVDDNRLDELINELEELAEQNEARIGPALLAEIIRRVRQTPTVRQLATPAGLPVEAGPREWFRVQGDPNLYVGNGTGQPLRRIATINRPG